MSPTLLLLKHLIEKPSLTPDDAGCQAMISQRLQALGFHVEQMRFGLVDNLWARHGTQSPLMVFAGHTDVVPTGPLTAWTSDPFQPTERNGYLYGRGAADMKSGLAAMIVAAEHFLRAHPDYAGSIGFLITSDEEGPSIDGTRRVIETLEKRGEKIDYCIVGEATCNTLLGDQIRVGRRGSLNGKITIHGKQGHTAFPQLAINPIHTALAALQEIINTEWDQGNAFFPQTSLQLSNIHAGTGALNVIPGILEAVFNFRYSTELTTAEIKRRMLAILEFHQLAFSLEFQPGAEPFLSSQGKLVDTVKSVIKQVVGFEPALSTGGGTSDARFIVPTGAEVIELGPINASIHQVDEHVLIADLEVLTGIYEKILERLFK